MSQPTEIHLPDLGDLADVEVIEVLVREGDAVTAEQGLITVEADKAAVEVPSPFPGVVRALEVSVGDRVSKGDLVALLELAVPVVDAPPPELASSEVTEPIPEAPPADPSPAARHQRAPAAPSVRLFARQLGVDLGEVRGGGVRGRITRADVAAHVKSVMRGGGTGGALPQLPAVDFSRFGPIEVEPLSRIQRIAGQRLHAAWVNIPHVTQHDEVDITDLETVRRALKTDAKAHGAKLTPLSFLIRAVARTLKEFPRFNAFLTFDDRVVLKKYFHIGFAVDTPDGLVVPVIRDVDQKSLRDIALELGELGAKARAGGLAPEDLRGGTFTISSLGSIGGTGFSPVINAPEVAILGVSRAVVKPVWDGQAFQPRTMLPLSLSYDHRVIDGAAAVRFTRHLAGLLERVERLVL